MNLESVDLKQTVNLPRTSFSMKANLPQTEPKMLEKWEAEDLYGEYRQSRAGRPTYILHDGPPYANGRIHLGTALNEILKDMIVKSRSMAGFDAPYVPGWDCHGLPIEHKVDQELGRRRRCLRFRFAAHAANTQRNGWTCSGKTSSAGRSGRWNDPYLTMNPGIRP
jgi:isoleucyl-tRNA synthetase